MFFKVVFHLDGSGLLYDPFEPLHLDALLAWTLAPRQGVSISTRSDIPKDVELPLMKTKIEDEWVWCASALFPDGVTSEDLRFWRKRFRASKSHFTKGSPNLTNGPYRDWNMPMQIFLATRMVAYANGNRKRCKKLLREIRYLGKKRAYGLGKIIGIELQQIESDFSIIRDGIAQRWLPSSEGTRLVRPRPPYWHPYGRVKCCEVGDVIQMKRL